MTVNTLIMLQMICFQ